MKVERIRRRETYSFSDFMAICGGLLGLFVGMSVLSVNELIYYLTGRYYWREKRKRQALAKQQTNDNNIVNVIPVDKISEIKY